MRKILPGKLCWACGEFDPGIRIVLALVMLFRLVATMIGCAYGPYLYLVLPLGGLYLAADALLLYAIWKALAAVRPVRIILRNWQPVLGGRYLRQV